MNLKKGCVRFSISFRVVEGIAGMSWINVKLGDICDLFNGYAFKSSDYVDISNTLSCRMSNIRPGGIFNIEYNARYLPDNFVEKYKQFLLRDGDVVIAMTDLADTPKILGVPTVIKTNGKNILLNQRVGKLIIKDRNIVHFPYLQLALNFPKVRAVYKKFAGGGLQINLGKKDLLSIELPLPPLPEQKKIAEILDAADSLRQKDQQLVEHYDRLSQSLFLDMFGDVFNNTKGFSIALFSELVEKVQIGPFGSQLHKCDYVENGIPLINPVHIVNSKIIPNHAFSLRTEKYKSLPNYHLKAGDLIMGRRGEMGRCALVTEKEDGFFCGTGSLYLRLNNKVTPLFLMKTITSKSGKEYLERNAQGVTMMNLNKKIILNIEIGLPPIELQNKFETSICAIEKQKELAQQSLKKSEDLFNSLLQRAFKGELTNTQ